MRKLILSVAAGATLLAGALFAGGAQALVLPGSGGIAAATEPLSLTDDVRYVCSRYWNGWRWRTRCFWRPNYYIAPYPFYRPYPYYYRPYPYRYRYYRRW